MVDTSKRKGNSQYRHDYKQWQRPNQQNSVIESDGPWIGHLDNWSWMSFHGLMERCSEDWVVDAVGLGFTTELFSVAMAFLCYAMLCLVDQSYPTLSDPMNCSPPGSSVCGILQARILQWVAIFFYRGSSQPRNQIRVSRVAGRFFTVWATKEV